VLFADLAGFTTLAEARDPEDVHALIDRCFGRHQRRNPPLRGQREPVHRRRRDGTLRAPIAHEDGPRRAVHAALGIQRAIRVLTASSRRRRMSAFSSGSVSTTGPVVVGKIGDDLRMDYTAVGDTTNLAARMQQAARPGSVVIGEATHAAVEGYFETLDLGRSPPRAAPRARFEVLRPAAAARAWTSPPSAAHAARRPDARAGGAARALRGGAGRRRQVVVIAGDAGPARADSSSSSTARSTATASTSPGSRGVHLIRPIHRPSGRSSTSCGRT